MPSKSLKFCSHTGCNELTTERYCEIHREQHELIEKEKNTRYEKARGEESAQIYDRTWQKVRLAYLKRFPLCEECERQGKTTPAVLVHHIENARDNPELRLDPSNLQSLCQRCHEDIHGKDRFKRR